MKLKIKYLLGVLWLAFACPPKGHAADPPSTPSKENSQPQDSTRANAYGLYLDFPLVDFPFLRQAAHMRVAKRGGTSGEVPAFRDYVAAYESPSMPQALAFTKNFHSTNYYLNNQLWGRLLPPDTRRRAFYNRVLANLSSGLVDLLFTYQGVLFSPQWLHEEFHRNALTIHRVPSYDETYNRLNGGYANGSVSRVLDEDLVRLKQQVPQELVRSFAAGIESEFLLMRGLQKDNFYRAARYPNVLLNVLLTKHAVDYVNQFKRPDFNASIDSMNHYGTQIADRDFVGWDFTAWVYDLFRPDEPYAARGIHPSGVGIDRARKTTTLTQEEYDYLAKMGKLQYLNFLSPFMLGVNRIRLNQHTAFNFAVRHYLTGFGYDLSTDLLLEHKGRPYLLSFHGYQNKHRFYPGLELESTFLLPLPSGKELRLQPLLMLWQQPVRQRFDDQKGQLGGLLHLKAAYRLNPTWSLYAAVETKTSGWVAGHPYLRPNTGGRLGFLGYFGKKYNDVYL
ncbi:hypothetical protein GCM10027275_47460 [Rhabdobacter roseus]|uniref:DUF1302 domain-containing protein n=1 Tax=Rhabdobacter roseus TaxID=1655419 RepID=A0A840TYK2_9BACT|nr:hypothetical protein [Rhabdobacter roseus]MBB5286373.1 hypothetical protein [Rhabdobacter roseus]